MYCFDYFLHCYNTSVQEFFSIFFSLWRIWGKLGRRYLFLELRVFVDHCDSLFFMFVSLSFHSCKIQYGLLVFILGICMTDCPTSLTSGFPCIVLRFSFHSGVFILGYRFCSSLSPMWSLWDDYLCRDHCAFLGVCEVLPWLSLCHHLWVRLVLRE